MGARASEALIIYRAEQAPGAWGATVMNRRLVPIPTKRAPRPPPEFDEPVSSSMNR